MGDGATSDTSHLAGSVSEGCGEAGNPVGLRAAIVVCEQEAFGSRKDEAGVAGGGGAFAGVVAFDAEFEGPGLCRDHGGYWLG